MYKLTFLSAALYYNDFFRPPRHNKNVNTKKSDAGSVRFHDEVRVRKIKAKGKNHPVSSTYINEDDDDDESSFFTEQGDEISSEGSEEGPDEGSDEESDSEESEADQTMHDTIHRLQDDLFADEEDDFQQGWC
jgi:U3 small nucleolar RNA-associated protein MPP10